MRRDGDRPCRTRRPARSGCGAAPRQRSISSDGSLATPPIRCHGSGSPSIAVATRCEASAATRRRADGRSPDTTLRHASPSTHHAIMPAMSDDLVARLVEASELHGDFVLSSGERSTVYFDKFLFLTRPDLLRELAHEVATLRAGGRRPSGGPRGRRDAARGRRLARDRAAGRRRPQGDRRRTARCRRSRGTHPRAPASA